MSPRRPGEEPVALALSIALRALRQRARLTQEAVAYAGGVYPAYYGSIERGQSNPTIVVVFELARGLGVSAEELVATTATFLPVAERRLAARRASGAETTGAEPQ
jgi:transcriptional regulator with XRE-family HTH domain